MNFQRSIFRSIIRAGKSNQASWSHGLQSGRNSHALCQIHQNTQALAGTVKQFNINTALESSVLGNLGLMRMPKNVAFPYTFCCRSYMQPGSQADTDTGRTNRSIEYAQGLLENDGDRSKYGRLSMYPPRMEGNADIVHIKLMRNNAFVTLTDSKGNKKLGTSAGKLAGKGGKLTRYSADAAAEDIGQKVRQMKTKSVVVKVNGATFFRKKRQAILSFKDGYSHSRGDSHPIVYIEDTTRKPHNGCRLRKKRRI